MSVLSALVGFSGPILILSGYVKPGIASTAGGSASGGISFYWMRLAKDANDRLDKLSASHDRNALKE
nr:hypothetical protein [Gloeothece citriformis]